MNKKNISLFLAIVLGLSAIPVYAEDGSAQVGASVGVTASVEGEIKPPVIPVRKPLMGNGEVRVNAQAGMGASTTMTREQMKAAIEARVEMFKQSQEEFKLQLQARMKAMSDRLMQNRKQMNEKRLRLQEEAKNRVKGLLKTIFGRLSDRIAVIVQVDARIADRINVLKQGGTDITAVSAQFTISQTALAKAKSDVEVAKTLAQTEVDTETSKESLRTLVKTAEQSIEDALKEYRKTIDLLRPEMKGGIKIEGNASSTTSL